MTEEGLLRRAEELERDLAVEVGVIRHMQRQNYLRVLATFGACGVSSADFRSTNGYGIDDRIRGKVEAVFARLYGADSALVRPQIISGTHALAIALFGVLRPGDLLACVTGEPYDTMEEIIGIRPSPGSLAEFGVQYAQCNLCGTVRSEWSAVLKACFGDRRPRMVLIQRSRGYARRKSMTSGEVATVISELRQVVPSALILVDNCYGDLVDLREPSMDGADLLASSFMKNLGAGIVPTGGYIVGTREAVSLAATRFSSPGVGAEIGPSLGFGESILRGLMFAPLVLEQALIGSLLAGALLAEHGFTVSPGRGDPRGDIVLAIEFGTRQRLLAFARAIQELSALDADAVPQPAAMQGYECPVLMSGGTFVQGSTIELSFDAPVREPYTGYLQGGLHAWQIVSAVARGIIYCINA
jgi:cystathionine beta-lyase family protein involved in aluminum resistance